MVVLRPDGSTQTTVIERLEQSQGEGKNQRIISTNLI